jgi:hypothetical protein
LEGVFGLGSQRDLHAFDDPLRRSDEMFRLFKRSAFDRLVGRREAIDRASQIQVLCDEVRNLGPHRFHAAMNSLRPLQFRFLLLRRGSPFRVGAHLREFLDLRDACLSRVDRIPVPCFRIRGLGIVEHLCRGIDWDSVRLRAGDFPAGLSEDFGRRAPEGFPGRGDIVFDAVEERIRLEEPAFLDRDRDVRELAFQSDGIVLAGLAEGDDVVACLEDAVVQ